MQILKMKTKVITIFAALAAGLLFISSCNNELDIEKKGNLGKVEDAYGTDENALAAVATCYQMWGFELFELQNILDNLSDDMWTGGGGSTDYYELQTLNRFMFGSDNSAVTARFTHLYTLIYDANLILEYVTKNETITPVMKQVISEAYFFRGWAYLYLGAAWGNVPIVDHLLSPSEYSLTNNTQAEVLAQSVADLKAAIDYGGLPSKSSKGDVQKRITREAAYAFLGKAYVFAGDYSSAATALGNVIDSNLYDLEPTDKYGDILKPATKNGPEVIASRYMITGTEIQDWGAPQGIPNYYSDGVERGWRNDHFDWAAANAVSPVIQTIMPGYGECTPRASLYNDMKAWETAQGSTSLSRLKQTIVDKEWMEANGMTLTDVFWGNEGFWNFKNRFLIEEVNSNYGYGGWNVWINNEWRAMRYSEVLLLAAEAYLQSGNTAKATDCLNKVRTRAGENAVGAATMDLIKNEKRFELCFEGCRFLDLVRWGEANTRLKDQGKVIKGLKTDWSVYDAGTFANAGFVQGKNELLPIPETELLVNPNIKQNPGWGSGSEEE